MGQQRGSTASESGGEIRGLLTSPGFLVGAAMVIMSALFATTGSPGLAELAMLVGIAGYVVAGALAPPWPFVTGFLLAIIHGATAAALDQLIEQPPPGDGFAEIGAAFFVLIYAASMVLGAFVTGIVGIIAHSLKTRGR